MDASLHLEFAEFLAYDSPRKFGIDPQQQVVCDHLLVVFVVKSMLCCRNSNGTRNCSTK